MGIQHPTNNSPSLLRMRAAFMGRHKLRDYKLSGRHLMKMVLTSGAEGRSRIPSPRPPSRLPPHPHLGERTRPMSSIIEALSSRIRPPRRPAPPAAPRPIEPPAEVDAAEAFLRLVRQHDAARLTVEGPRGEFDAAAEAEGEYMGSSQPTVDYTLT